METRDIRYENEYRYLRKSRRTLKRVVYRLAKLNMILSVLVIFLIGFIIIAGNNMIVKNRNLENQLAKVNSELETVNNTNKELTENLNELSDEYEKVSTLSVVLDDQNKSLVKQINSLNKTLDEYEEREELFDKYEYALIREDGTHTDITYEEIQNLYNTAEELNMSEESICLILSVAMVESQGTESAKNTDTTATGLGQILSGTGKFVWTDLMDNSGRYIHSSVASDGNTNLQMMAYLLNYLNDKYNGNVINVMKEYRGENDVKYFEKIDTYLDTAGLSLKSLSISDDD